MPARTILGTPLIPGVLHDLGALGASFPPPRPKDFDPTGAWTHVYRVWTCHGYIEEDNDTVGFLRVDRVPTLPNRGGA
mgnify:CR=1 FL=1